MSLTRAAAGIGGVLLLGGCVSQGGDPLNARIMSVSAIHSSDLTPEGTRRLGVTGRRDGGPIVFNDLRCRDIRPELRQRFPECLPRDFAYGGSGDASGSGEGAGPGGGTAASAGPSGGPGSSGPSATSGPDGVAASHGGAFATVGPDGVAASHCLTHNFTPHSKILRACV